MRLKYNYFKWPIKTRSIIAAVLWLCLSIIAFFCSSSGHQFIDWTKEKINIAYQKTNRNLRQVDINWLTPNHYTKTEEILKTIHIKQGEAMDQIQLSEIQHKIEKLPWVRTAIVERYWPDTIIITIEEKMPLALWQNSRKYHPLDDQAQVIDTTNQLPADLLLVVGPDAPKHLIPLIQDLEQVPDIYQYVRAAVRVGERRWNLKLFNVEKGLEILLPETNVLAALQRLDTHNKQEKLIKRKIAAIDLRTKDKVILKPIESSQPKAKKK